MTTKDLARIALSVALIAVGAWITIPLGPVPFTLQTFAIILVALILRPAHAALATFVYMLIGLIGIPVFAGFSGGFQSLVSPSFGFIISFIPMAYIISHMAHGSMDNKKIALAILVGVLVSYLIGLIWLKVALGKIAGADASIGNVFAIGMVPFIIPDTLKAVLAAIIYKRIYKYVATDAVEKHTKTYESK